MVAVVCHDLDSEREGVQLTFSATGSLYADFSNEVHSLKTALQNVKAVVDNATRNLGLEGLGSIVGSSSVLRLEDEHALRLICGDFRQILEQCQDLLQSKKAVFTQGGIAQQVRLDMTGVNSKLRS